MPALAPNSLIAVTGITGYVASHVGLATLQAGHRVRGTVRSLERAEALKAGYQKQGISAEDLDRRLEFVVLDDLSSEEQYLRALNGVDGVAHVALSWEGGGEYRFVELTVNGMLAFVRAASKIPSIKRVVLTSSSAAVITPPAYRDEPLTGDDWNDEAVKIVEDNKLGKPDGSLVYGAAKTQAEKAAWEFVEKEKPQFDLVAILPNMNIGPVLHGKPTSTAGWMADILKNDPKWAQLIPPQWFVDVRDDGRLHVIAFTTPSLAGKRIWGAAEPFGWNAIFAIVRKNFPNVQVPADVEGAVVDKQKVDNKPATELLGGWISLEQSVVDFTKSLGY